MPLVGTRRRSRLAEALAAVAVHLDDVATNEIERTLPAGAAAGGRYAAPQLAILDSER